MKQFTFLLILICTGFAATAQPCRYTSRVFSQVAKISDVVYANVPSIPAVYVAENVTTDLDLKMDIWQPIGDTMLKRPLIILAHGGGFISGTKDNNDMQYLADTLAHYGYVTASIDYRITLNATSTGSVERAIWRATQDGSAAIRFMKEKSELYGIDTNQVFVLGSSAGTFLWLSEMYCSNAERLQSTYSAAFPPQPDLGCKDCEGNSYTHSSRPNALVGCWGAIQDTSWISATEYIPAIMFHGDADPVVPYSEGYPFSALFTAPWVYGSALMHERLNHLGEVHEFYSGAGQLHEYWGVVNGAFPPGPVTDPDWEGIIVKTTQFLYNVMGQPNCTAVSINYPTENKTKMWIDGNALIVEKMDTKPFSIQVYSLEGKMLLSRILPAGKSIVGLDGVSGLVVVKAAAETRKLVSVENLY